MSIKVQVSIRSKKLGVLIRDARLAAHLAVPTCAQAIGVKSGTLRAWEEGRFSPSLPELELLAYALQQPLRQFWGKEAKSDDASKTSSMNLPAFLGIRQRLIGAHLRQQRENAGMSMTSLSEQSGVPVSRLKSYELGLRPIPLPVLEGLIAIAGGQIESMFDQTSAIGQWRIQQKAIQEFLELPLELQNFVSKPINRPYLELALKLSDMSTDKLRAVAENILDITY
jgi:transcriptional regulator with XRE-family HTH domain